MSLPMPAAIRCHSILAPDSAITPGTLLLGDDGRIVDVGSSLSLPVGAHVIELPDATLVPGFIDLHVHGGGGFSLATRDADEIRSYSRWVVAHGVTSFLPTICAANVTEGLDFVRTAAQVTGPVEGGANVLGVNLEGPFVNPERRGALPQDWPIKPTADLVDRLLEAAARRLGLMTLAPEVEGVEEVVRRLVEQGVVASVGHSDANYKSAANAFREGARHVTHLFNAMRPFHQRDPGILGAAFDSRDVTVEVIADGIHVHPTTVAMITHLFGPDRIALISDAVPPAASDSRTFRLGDDEATRWGDRVLLTDGTIAGGAETMDHIVRNVVWWQATDLAGAARMASPVPARVVGLSERKGRLAPGYDGDLVALDGDLEVNMTWVQGCVVYARAATTV
jgi:N-acetylglucosamine-6-phosphate deacetylase